MRGKLAVVVILVVVVGVALAFLLRRGEVRQVPVAAEPVNFAHRGGAALAPENTLEAFRRGLEAGADRLEMDVHVTGDGRVVVIHDATVDRTTDGSGDVRQMTLREIRRLDAGYRFTRDGVTYPFRGRGLTVPTLDEVYRSFPGVPVNMEIKSALGGREDIVYDVIRNHRAEDRTIVAAADHGIMQRFRKVSGGSVATAATKKEIRDFLFASRTGREARLAVEYRALQVPESYRGVRIVNRRFVETAHRLKLRVDVWTVDDPAAMRRLWSLGVDGIMTDRPDLLAAVLAERPGIGGR